MAARAKRQKHASKRSSGHRNMERSNRAAALQASVGPDATAQAIGPAPDAPADPGGGAFGDTLVGILNEALAQHQAGDLAAAEALYDRALQIAPDHPNALHHLGIIHHQRGDHDRAVDLIGRAIALIGRGSRARTGPG